MASETIERAAVLIICLAASLPYLGIASSYFVADDFGSLNVFYDKPLPYFLSLFTRSWRGAIWGPELDELRPFPALALQIGIALGNGSPVPFHAMSITIHMTNALLVFAIARRATGLSTSFSTLAAFLFATHPIQAETVSWITSQSESLMTLFCLSSFWTWVRYRQTTRWMWAAISAGLLFCALFCKQTAIVTLALFVLYDVFFAKLGWRDVWHRLLDYFPAALLTVGYLLLRVMIFSEAVRESSITLEALGLFILVEALFGVMILSGETVIVRNDVTAPVLEAIAVLAVVLIGASTVYRNKRTIALSRDLRLFLFATIWFVIATAPSLVAEYVTSRHLYLASTGVAIGLAVLASTVWRATQRRARPVVALTTAGVLLFWLLKLEATVWQWQRAGHVSEVLVRAVEQEVEALPPGALVILDVPAVLSSPTLPHRGVAGRPWIWAWAMPFAVQPPFTRQNLIDRAEFIVSLDVYCCPDRHWMADMASTATRWLSRADRPPVRILRWDATTNSVHSESSVTEDMLRGMIVQLARARTADEMTSVLNIVFGKVNTR